MIFLNTIIKSKVGFSITELLVGTTLAGIVAGAGGYVVYKANEQSFTASWQTQLNSEHLLSIQRMKDTNRLAQLLNLRTAQAEACFAKKASANNCSSLNVPEFRPLNDPGNACGADCAFDKRVQYKINCTTNQCDGVYLQVSTNLNPTFAQARNVSAAKREATIHVPGTMFASRKQLDFRCTSGNRFVSQVSFDSLAANCEAFTGATGCASANPLRTFGNVAPNSNCQQMLQNTNCGYGFNQLGVFSGQSGCNAGGGGITTITTSGGGGGSCSYAFSRCDCTARTKIATITAPGATCDYNEGQSVICSTEDLNRDCPIVCAPRFLSTNPGGGDIVVLSNGGTCYCPATFSDEGTGDVHPTLLGCKCADNQHFINGSGRCELCAGNRGIYRNGTTVLCLPKKQITLEELFETTEISTGGPSGNSTVVHKIKFTSSSPAGGQIVPPGQTVDFVLTRNTSARTGIEPASDVTQPYFTESCIANLPSPPLVKVTASGDGSSYTYKYFVNGAEVTEQNLPRSFCR